ncbi:hypothetical protein AVEN_142397-1 [Araneus ventricosus]|uniref:Uncharacterized protein n=1 Tax=Araneus ventricosus TaxID=182803 RepID=A0A4Y2FD44_ARAVE|nr:hypothetical protein AVEN_142397-1 [Araneus ventricosus]
MSPIVTREESPASLLNQIAAKCRLKFGGILHYLAISLRTSLTEKAPASKKHIVLGATLPFSGVPRSKKQRVDVTHLRTGGSEAVSYQLLGRRLGRKDWVRRTWTGEPTGIQAECVELDRTHTAGMIVIVRLKVFIIEIIYIVNPATTLIV